jgi:signal transduction histidine kinase
MRTKFFDLPLRFQIIIPFSLLIIVVAAVAVGFGIPLANKSASESADLKLENARSLFLLLLDHETSELSHSAGSLAQTSEVATALANGDMEGLSDMLEAAPGTLDALQVTNAEGITLASAGGHTPLSAETLAEPGPVAGGDDGGTILPSPVGHMLVSVRPIGSRESPEGFVAAGRLLNRLLPDLELTDEAELALYYDGELAASTFASGHSQRTELVSLPIGLGTATAPVKKGSVVDGRAYAAAYDSLEMGADAEIAFAVFVPKSSVWPADMLVAGGLAAVLVVPLVLLVLGFATARAIASRLERVVGVIENVGGGDFQQRVDIDSTDEVGRLAHVVNRMAARLHEAETSKAEFLAMASHEVRTPLTLIRNASELLLDGSEQTDEASNRELLQMINGNVERMNRRVADLLILARMDAGHLSLRLRPTDLTPLVDEAAESVRPMLAGKEQSLSLELPSRLHAASADPDRIQQVLLNLLTNASRHTPPGTRISVRAADDGDTVKVEVEDNGPGIPQEQLEQLLNGKRRPPTKDAGGLGLLIAQRLVALHSGRLWATSGPSGGSVFAFALPHSSERKEVIDHEDPVGG